MTVMNRAAMGCPALAPRIPGETGSECVLIGTIFKKESCMNSVSISIKVKPRGTQFETKT